MKLSIVGCPDKKLFRPFVKRAAIFYAETLISKKLLNNIFVKIKFDNKLPYYGTTEVEEYNDWNKPREFLIQLHPGVGAANILETLAHEMVHVKQFAYSDTNEPAVRWRGNKEHIGEYYTEPWEIEAHGLESGLFTKFVVQEMLWEIFDGINNPDAPIKNKPIGWKI